MPKFDIDRTIQRKYKNFKIMALSSMINSGLKTVHHKNIPLVSLLTKRLCSEDSGTYKLPNLPYPYDCLEPVICKDIMVVHHQGHHKTYVDNLNKLEKELANAVAKQDLTKVLSLGPALKFNGGGHLNHSLFWESLSPSCSEGSRELMQALIDTFGSYKCFKEDLAKLAISVEGSGWAWLGYDTKARSLKLAKCANQDPLEATTGLKPLLGIDVWEHAYYLQYKNCRADYVTAIFDIVNWECVAKRYTKATC